MQFVKQYNYPTTIKFAVNLINKKTREPFVGEVNIYFPSEKCYEKNEEDSFYSILESDVIDKIILKKYPKYELDGSKEQDSTLEIIRETNETPDIIMEDEEDEEDEEEITIKFAIKLINKKTEDPLVGEVIIQFPSMKCYEKHYNDSFYSILESDIIDKFILKKYRKYELDGSDEEDSTLEIITKTDEIPDIIIVEDEVEE